MVTATQLIMAAVFQARITMATTRTRDNPPTTAPMGVQLYLQTIITQPDADVECLDAQSSNTDVVPVAAIDLDANGEADICQLRRGDLDLNGVIDQNDLAILFDMIGTEPVLGIGDMDANGVIDESDMSMLLQKM